MENKKIYELELLKKKSKNFFRITIPINTNKKDNQFKTRGFLEALLKSSKRTGPNSRPRRSRSVCRLVNSGTIPRTNRLNIFILILPV